MWGLGRAGFEDPGLGQGLLNSSCDPELRGNGGAGAVTLGLRVVEGMDL
jgi:hypothetical protein